MYPFAPVTRTFPEAIVGMSVGGVENEDVGLGVLLSGTVLGLAQSRSAYIRAVGGPTEEDDGAAIGLMYGFIEELNQ